MYIHTRTHTHTHTHTNTHTQTHTHIPQTRADGTEAKYKAGERAVRDSRMCSLIIECVLLVQGR